MSGFGSGFAGGGGGGGGGDGYLSNITPITIVPDATGSPGAGNAGSRYDHVHGIAAAAPSTNLDFSTTNSEGVATSFARSDHTHAFTAPAAPADVTKAAASAGSSNAFARADHKHDITTASVSDVGSANSEGSATSLARSDHVHNLPFTPVQTALAAATGSISINSQRITNVLDPINPQDVATRAYVLASGGGGSQTLAQTLGYGNTVDGYTIDGTSTRLRLNSDGYLQTTGNDTKVQWNSTGVGFHGTSPIAKPTLSGVRTLASTLTALGNYGLITDSTTNGLKLNSSTTVSTSTYGIQDSDELILVTTTTSGRSYLTLPSPSGRGIFTIKDAGGDSDRDGYEIVILPNASETIDGYAGALWCSSRFGRWALTSDGTNWSVLDCPSGWESNGAGLNKDRENAFFDDFYACGTVNGSLFTENFQIGLTTATTQLWSPIVDGYNESGIVFFNMTAANSTINMYTTQVLALRNEARVYMSAKVRFPVLSNVAGTNRYTFGIGMTSLGVGSLTGTGAAFAYLDQTSANWLCQTSSAGGVTTTTTTVPVVANQWYVLSMYKAENSNVWIFAIDGVPVARMVQDVNGDPAKFLMNLTKTLTIGSQAVNGYLQMDYVKYRVTFPNRRY